MRTVVIVLVMLYKLVQYVSIKIFFENFNCVKQWC